MPTSKIQKGWFHDPRFLLPILLGMETEPLAGMPKKNACPFFGIQLDLYHIQVNPDKDKRHF